MFYAVEHGHSFSLIDENTGMKRKAFADELTQPQQLFLFHAKEQRKAMRMEDSGSGSGKFGDKHSKTHHIG